MKTLLTLTTLALLTTNANATINYCHPITGNWVNSAPTNCPPIVLNTPKALTGLPNTITPETPPPNCGNDCDPPPTDDPKVKNNHGHGNGNEKDCSGSGCNDPDNPGHGPKNQ